MFSSILFNMCIEEVTKEEQVRVGRGQEKVNAFRFVDDTKGKGKSGVFYSIKWKKC